MVTNAPGLSQATSRKGFRSGSAGMVVTMMSMPSTAWRASSTTRAARPSAAAAKAAALSRDRPNTAISSIGKTPRSAARWPVAWTPFPTKPIRLLLGRAKRRAATVLIADVRAAVIQVPSRNANGRPLTMSLRTTKLPKWGNLRAALAPERPTHLCIANGG